MTATSSPAVASPRAPRGTSTLATVALGGLAGINFWVLGHPEWFRVVTPAPASVYSTVTLMLILSTALAVALWPRLRATGIARTPAPMWWAGGVVAAIGVMALFTVASGWVERMRLIPLDPERADMVPLIQAALARFLEGRNPYSLYQMPWTLPLSYGPWLWLLFLPAYLLDVDLRLTTIAGQLFLPALVLVGAAGEAGARRVGTGLLLLALAVLVAFNPLFTNFVDIGHTPVYFPLLAGFALALGGGHLRLAALLLGTLIVARTVFVAIAPVLLMHVWIVQRLRVRGVALLMGAAAALPFLPFVLLDWNMVWQGMFGTYVSVIKVAVWQRPGGLSDTVGLTRVLLESGAERYAEVAQVLVMLVVYAAAWAALRRRQAAEPWMAVALLAFCMTTLWPVWYIFLDVFVFGAACVLVRAAPVLDGRLRLAWGTALVCALGLTAVAA